jgi:hypothetical protein
MVYFASQGCIDYFVFSYAGGQRIREFNYVYSTLQGIPQKLQLLKSVVHPYLKIFFGQKRRNVGILRRSS